jgi:hypothetical protein
MNNVTLTLTVHGRDQGFVEDPENQKQKEKKKSIPLSLVKLTVTL